MEYEKKHRYAQPNLSEATELYRRMFKNVGLPLRMFHRLKLVDPQNLPPAGQGGVIVAAIHNGPLDAALISAAAAERGRAVRWVADKDACNTPVIGPMIRGVGCIPIASVRGKGADPAQIKEAMAEAAAVVRDGGTVGIFPEGIIHPFFESKRTYEFKTGVIRLAIETGAPIIPTWARGAGAIFPWLSPLKLKGLSFYLALPLWLPVEVRVHFGKPFSVNKKISISSPYEKIKEQAARLQDSVEDLIMRRYEED